MYRAFPRLLAAILLLLVLQGCTGISYYAINQWHVAQLQPPHLTAMIPWEGAADYYRDWCRHGGILSNKFMEVWYPRQVQSVQHGLVCHGSSHQSAVVSSPPSVCARSNCWLTASS